MKNLLSLVVVVVLAINSVNAKGIEPKSPLGTSVIKSGNVFKLFYRGEKTGTVVVSIHNENGQMVWTEKFKKTENFMRPYNFSELPSGKYTIVLEDEKGTHIQNVTYAPKINKSDIRLKVINKDENKYALTVPNRGTNVISVKVYDAVETLLYRNTETVTGDFGKLYDLGKVKGAFTFEVSDEKGRSNRITIQ